MCEHCRSIPRLSGCPFEDEPPLFAYCERCGGEIFVGDYYFKFDAIYCTECIEDLRRTAE